MTFITIHIIMKSQKVTDYVCIRTVDPYLSEPQSSENSKWQIFFKILKLIIKLFIIITLHILLKNGTSLSRTEL